MADEWHVPLRSDLRGHWIHLADLAWKGFITSGCGAIVVPTIYNTVSGALKLDMIGASYLSESDLVTGGISGSDSYASQMVQQYDPAREIVVIVIQPDGSEGTCYQMQDLEVLTLLQAYQQCTEALESRQELVELERTW
jgi:hypothetical protein